MIYVICRVNVWFMLFVGVNVWFMLFVGVNIWFMLFVGVNVWLCYLYWLRWCPTRLPNQMIFLSFNSNMAGVTCGAGTANPSNEPLFTPGFRCSTRCAIFSFLSSVLSFCLFSFGHCIVYSSFSIWLDWME